MLFGASYYTEYQPEERLEKDLLLMKKAGVNFVRLGDSIWSLSEPQEGEIDFDWMQRTIDRLHETGVKIALATPTYAVPPWLARKYPEIMAMRPKNERVRFGARQNMDFTHAAYLFHAERIVRAMAERWASHPGVIGFQVDNETGVELLYNPNTISRFIDHMKNTFGSIDRVNEVFGLNYWSHRINDWADLWSPEGNTTPGYDLEWRRFQSQMTTEFLTWQANIVREYSRPDQWVSHDLVGGFGRPTADRHSIAAAMDVSSENIYFPPQDRLAITGANDAPELRDAIAGEVGAWSLYFKGDIGWSAKQSNFFVTETNGLSTGGPSNNYPAYDNQWRQAAYTLISRGADAIVYWHWNTLHYGAETYWGGMLPHDYSENRCFRELTRLGNELAQYEDRLTGLTPDGEVGILFSRDSMYGMQFQPSLLKADLSGPDRMSYERIFAACYHAAFDARAQTTIFSSDQDFESIPLLIVPALYIADSDLLQRLETYAKNGGHLLLTFRSGYADEFARARWETAPGPLRQAAGVSYSEYSNLRSSLRVKSSVSDLTIGDDARAEAWADGIEPEGATPLAWYDHPHFGRWPAVTSHVFGKGRVTYVGTLPNRPFGRDIVRWAMTQAEVRPCGTPDLAESVRISTARNRQGEHLWFVANWSQEPHQAVLPVDVHDLLGNEVISENTRFDLAPWDIRILVESHRK